MAFEPSAPTVPEPILNASNQSLTDKTYTMSQPITLEMFMDLMTRIMSQIEDRITDRVIQYLLQSIPKSIVGQDKAGETYTLPSLKPSPIKEVTVQN